MAHDMAHVISMVDAHLCELIRSIDVQGGSVADVRYVHVLPGDVPARIKLFNIYTLAPPFRGIKVQIFYNLKIHTFFKSVLLNTPFDPGGEITAYTERFMQCACADNARFISANNAR
ncbi:hypothetical protein AML29_15730 [Escherichia coli]|nr:hypothetical protein BX50_15505 [Escherichia coli O145:NM str. 2010C-3521]EYV24703.1 hypothetical protein BX48_02130 [Escherichia coli O145:NM str. 2010C-3517]EYV29153.1 hypothetical protein BX49_05660 [Escherichia coli O145:NM str. 2010C-3518]EYV47402.1 hypothetical protein BX42_02990 [Escherichia coli O145:NM str. 2010C-3507]EYV48434.1 hypothetical protein BX44_10455 [Escherichia coli O145:NM str. 2010C-3509]EZE93134.1 hypothetical protein BX43_15415 [Escherichia coli O145:NM str. 2010C-3